MIKQILNNEDKQEIARMILEALPEWFGIPEATEEYIMESAEQLFFCCFHRWQSGRFSMSKGNRQGYG